METISTIFVEACVACKWQLLMFIVAGIAFELLCEWAKAIIRQSTGKPTSLAVGTTLGLLASILYIVAAYYAYKGYNGEGGWMILGTPYFLWVWFILFYFWQYTSIKIAKPIFKRFFPTVNDPNYVKPVKVKEEKNTTADLDMVQELLERLMAEKEKKEE